MWLTPIVELRQYCDSEKWRTGANRSEQERTVAKGNSNVCSDFASRRNKIKPGAGDENRTRVLSLGS
jgi:hypothetical protein